MEGVKERMVNFTLFGQDFSFFTDAPEEESTRIIRMVQEELEAGNIGTRSNVPSSKMLVLGCLRIAARYVELEKEYKEFRRKQDVSIDKLIDKVSSEIE